MDLTLRVATDADQAFCEALNRSNMAPYLRARDIAWDPARFLASWAEFDNRLLVVDGATVGLLRLLETDNALEIRDLQIVPDWQRRGIGSWAIGQVQAEAVRCGLVEIRLRVYPDNPARQLYARLGFCIVTAGDPLHMACQVIQAADAAGCP